MMKTDLQHRVTLQAEIFGARGCTVPGCSCNPCDCNPCTCGESLLPSYPEWRVSGYAMTTGCVDHLDLSGHILLSLARPTQEGVYDHWQEVLLVDDQATPAHIAALVETCEGELESLPAEVEHSSRMERAIYKASIAYDAGAKERWLRVTFTPEQTALIRAASVSSSASLRPWSYNGPMALRGHFQR